MYVESNLRPVYPTIPSWKTNPIASSIREEICFDRLELYVISALREYFLLIASVNNAQIGNLF